MPKRAVTICFFLCMGVLALAAYAQDAAAPAAEAPPAAATTEAAPAPAEGATETTVTEVAVVEEAAEEGPTAADAVFTVNNVWMMVGTFLVFIMHLGFATLEAGLERAKNTVNILFKNSLIPAIGLLTFAAVGFNLAYPDEGNWIFGKYLGFDGFGITLPEGGGTSAYSSGYTYWTDFLFQGMFAATAATIVSGAVAGRVKLLPFLIFSAVYVAFCYPIVVSWKWGYGFLNDAGFHDFAGSTIVHSVGGWGALMGAIILGPRIGKYVNGSPKALPAHSLPLAVIGTFLLWLGWFGFNGASVLSADPAVVSFVLVTTCLAASAGIIGATVTSWIVQKHPDLSMVLNGCLAGLVGITAGADVVSVPASVIIGGAAGVLVVISVLFIDRVLKVDDPVGAISVHLVCGIWGTLAVGIFGAEKSIGAQLMGIGAAAVFCVITSAIIFLALKFTLGLRVDEEEEYRGLDIGEHGQEAYAGFQFFTTQ